MPIALLRYIASSELPLDIAGVRDTDMVCVLVLAGHIKASVPSAKTLMGHEQLPTKATVTEITPLGRVMLRSFPPRPGH